MRAIRGAIDAENTAQSILAKTEIMLNEIMQRNNLEIEEIISVHFTATKDLNAAYPAAAARGLGLTRAALMCMQEMDVAGSMAGLIRCCVFAAGEGEAAHVYLGAAAALRPDLRPVQIAIDGPGGSGKSSVARELARRLGFAYIDTGAMYRAVALAADLRGIDWENESAISAMMENISIDIVLDKNGQALFLDNTDVSTQLRSAEMGRGASSVAKYGAVREKMVDIQQNLAANRNVVMEGRDIASVVLPNASAKIYLDASPQIRASRRFAELTELGHTPDHADILAQIIARDKQDAARELAPLAIAPGATVVDTTKMDFDTVVKTLMEIISK